MPGERKRRDTEEKGGRESGSGRRKGKEGHVKRSEGERGKDGREKRKE